MKGRERNELVGREELQVEIDHRGEPTPSGPEVRDRLAAELDLDPKTVEIKSIKSSRGVSVSRGTIRVHDEPVFDELPGQEPEETGESEENQEEEEGEPAEEDREGPEEEPEDGEGQEESGDGEGEDAGEDGEEEQAGENQEEEEKGE